MSGLWAKFKKIDTKVNYAHLVNLLICREDTRAFGREVYVINVVRLTYLCVPFTLNGYGSPPELLKSFWL